jgi:hypothetical protein
MAFPFIFLLFATLSLIIIIISQHAVGILLALNNTAKVTDGNDPTFNTTKAYEYLVNRYNAHYRLIRENENLDRYWLWSDNVLAARALKDYNYSLYANITNTIRSYIQNYHIELHTAWDALIDPTSIVQQPSFKSPINKNLTDKIWYSDYGGSYELPCTDYADIAFLKSIYFYEINKLNDSKTCCDQGINMFDGIGFKDKAFAHDGYRYSTYKVALWKIATDIIDLSDSKEAKHIISSLQNLILAKVQNDETGGVYTFYLPNFIHSNQTNVETTSLAIMAGNGIELPRQMKP